MMMLIVSSAVAILCSALCSLLEATLLSLDSLHLQTRKREGHRYAAIWLNMKERIDRPIAAILILNTVAHTGGATVAGSAFDEVFGDEWIWAFSAIFTAVILIFTEILPKVIGVSHNERLAPVLAPILSVMTVALKPAVALTEWLARPFKKESGPRGISIGDIQTMAGLAHTERAIEEEQESIIINATKLRNTRVRDVMVPPERIALFHSAKSNIENFETAATALHTRYPVSKDGTIEGIIGYVNFKELVASAPSRREVDIPRFIRPLERLSYAATLNEALRRLLGHSSHMALVEDEERRTLGLVTLEDVLEEIVGELQDEFDYSAKELIEVAPGRWKAGGGAGIEELTKRAGLPPGHPSPATLADWLQQKMGREVRSGDVTTHGRATFTVIQTRRHKAHRVLIEIAPDKTR